MREQVRCSLGIAIRSAASAPILPRQKSAPPTSQVLILDFTISFCQRFGPVRLSSLHPGEAANHHNEHPRRTEPRDEFAPVAVGTLITEHPRQIRTCSFPA